MAIGSDSQTDSIICRTTVIVSHDLSHSLRLQGVAARPGSFLGTPVDTRATNRQNGH